MHLMEPLEGRRLLSGDGLWADFFGDEEAVTGTVSSETAQTGTR